MIARFLTTCGALSLLLSSPVQAQQVVFSRRVYATQGSTYQQLWIWTAANGRLTPLTRTPRDHTAPVCSPDGHEVFFESPGPAAAVSHWRLNRDTGSEQLAEPVSPAAVAAGAYPPGVQAQCDEGTIARSADGSRLACAGAGKAIVIMDAGTQKALERIPFAQRYRNGEPYPDWPLQPSWSPDGRALLVGTYGEGASSTTPQLDYFVLDLAAKMWTRAMTGNDAVWLPSGRAMLYSTPRDLVPLGPAGKPSVWSAQLAMFDLATGKTTLLTSGVSNNLQPAVCVP
jgi:Tol biopolymer transport system component